MKLTLGFSPCPNDTFIFDALIHHKIDTEGLEFDVSFEDVETLNQQAFRAELDITKLSYHAYAYAAADYVLLDAGSALGFGVGPLLICKDPECARAFRAMAGTGQPSDLKIGIPGKYTTANFLLGVAYPAWQNKEEIIFSDIENALLEERIDAGLIIHENRFTYVARGLHKVIDLGEYWESETGLPIPLGGIVVKRSLSEDVKHKVARVLRRSVEYAFANPESGMDFIREHAQEMDDTVMYQHIELYVNRYSLDLGEEGRKAVTTLFERAQDSGVVPRHEHPLFLS